MHTDSIAGFDMKAITIRFETVKLVPRKIKQITHHGREFFHRSTSACMPPKYVFQIV